MSVLDKYKDEVDEPEAAAAAPAARASVLDKYKDDADEPAPSPAMSAAVPLSGASAETSPVPAQQPQGTIEKGLVSSANVLGDALGGMARGIGRQHLAFLGGGPLASSMVAMKDAYDAGPKATLKGMFDAGDVSGTVSNIASQPIPFGQKVKQFNEQGGAGRLALTAAGLAGMGEVAAGVGRPAAGMASDALGAVKAGASEMIPSRLARAGDAMAESWRDARMQRSASQGGLEHLAPPTPRPVVGEMRTAPGWRDAYEAPARPQQQPEIPAPVQRPAPRPQFGGVPQEPSVAPGDVARAVREAASRPAPSQSGPFGGVSPDEAAPAPDVVRDIKPWQPSQQQGPLAGLQPGEASLPPEAVRALKYSQPMQQQGPVAGLSGEEAAAAAAPGRQLQYPPPMQQQGALLQPGEGGLPADAVQAVRARPPAPAAGAFAGLEGAEVSSPVPAARPITYRPPAPAPGAYAGLAESEVAAPAGARPPVSPVSPPMQQQGSFAGLQPGEGRLPPDAVIALRDKMPVQRLPEPPTVHPETVRNLKSGRAGKPSRTPVDPALDFSLDAMGHRPRAHGK